MQKNLYPGKFIVFEGIDGSGQTTQSHVLVDALGKRFIPALYSKGPRRQSDAGKKIFEVLEGRLRMDHKELQELYTIDHAERLAHDIIPALTNGTWVVSDRYMFSTIAYGAANGVDTGWLFSQASSFLLPDITFYLTVSPKEAMDRIQKRGQQIHELFEKEETLSRVKASYETILSRFQGVQRINGEQSIEKVHQDIISAIQAEFLL